MYEPRDDDDAVRHLVTLGYVDPDVLAARKAAVRRELEAEFQQAVKRYEEGDLQEARRRFALLISDDPNWVAPRQLLAEIHYRTGDWIDAQSQIDWLTLHGVEHPRLALIAGAIALASRDFRAALEVLKYAAHVEPTLPSVHTLLGTVLRRLGDLDRAEDEYRKATGQNPSDVHALDGLAAICIERRDFSEAANLALEALDRDMQFFTAHYRLGVALAQLDRPNEAIAALEISAKLNARAAAPYYWLAQIAANQLRDPALAAQYREKAREVIRRRRHVERTDRDISDE
jgi:predicted Zn-dependent protease